jgi:hypothetical protein
MGSGGLLRASARREDGRDRAGLQGQLRMREPHLREPCGDEARPQQAAADEAGVDDIGVVEFRGDQKGVDERHALHPAVSNGGEFGFCDEGVAEIGQQQQGARELHSFQIRDGEADAGEIRVLEIDETEAGSREVGGQAAGVGCAAELRVLEVAVGEMRPLQDRGPELCGDEAPADELGVRQNEEVRDQAISDEIRIELDRGAGAIAVTASSRSFRCFARSPRFRM